MDQMPDTLHGSSVDPINFPPRLLHQHDSTCNTETSANQSPPRISCCLMARGLVTAKITGVHK